MKYAVLVLVMMMNSWSWASSQDAKALMHSQFRAAEILSLDILEVNPVAGNSIEISYRVQLKDGDADAINDVKARARFQYSAGKWVLLEVLDMDQTLTFSTGQSPDLR